MWLTDEQIHYSKLIEEREVTIKKLRKQLRKIKNITRPMPKDSPYRDLEGDVWELADEGLKQMMVKSKNEEVSMKYIIIALFITAITTGCELVENENGKLEIEFKKKSK